MRLQTTIHSCLVFLGSLLLLATVHAQTTTPFIVWPTPAADSFPTPLSNLQLDATALTGPPVIPTLPYNLVGIASANSTYTSSLSMDGGGYSFAAALTGTSLSFDGITFPLGSPGASNALDAVASLNNVPLTILLPRGNYSALLLIADMVNNTNPQATFTLNYTDGTSSPVVLNMSDWVNVVNQTGESRAACFPYRAHNNGTNQQDSVCMDGYTLPANPAKTLASFTLPASRDYVVLSAALLPPVVSGSFLYTPAAGVITPVGNNTLTTVFMPANPASYGTANASVVLHTSGAATQIPTTVTWLAPATIPSPTPLGPAQLDATASASLAAAVQMPVSALSSLTVIASDGSAYGRGGFDTSGDVYSANALGTSVTYAGASFTLGAPLVPDAVTSVTIQPTAPGNYQTLYLIGAAANAAQTSQPFTVAYTDGTTATVSLSLSAWNNPQRFPGETIVASTSYADTAAGGRVNGTYDLYGYQIPLDTTRAVASVTLPNNPNVILLAAGLGTAFTLQVPGSFAYTPGAGSFLPAQPSPQPLSVVFTPTDNVDYAPSTGSTTILVTPVTLTVQAANASRLYGAPNPAFTGSITGEILGDTFTEVFSTPATLASPPGNYPVIPSAVGTKLPEYQAVLQSGMLTVTQAPSTVSVSASAASAPVSTAVTLTASAHSTTSGTPTGTITFYDNGNLLATAALLNGAASLTTTTLPPGSNVITASYGGDTNFLAAVNSSNSVPITVTINDFTLTAPYGTSVSTSYGGSAQLKLHISPNNGAYSSAVTFVASGNLPPLATIGFSPNPVPSTAGATDIIVTFNTQRLSSSVARPTLPRSAFFALLFFLPIAIARHRHRFKILLVPFAFLLINSLSGCGSGYASGAFPVTITASSIAVQHSVQLTLNMQGGPQ